MDVLHDRDEDLADTAGLLTTELVTNAVRHAATPIVFRLDTGPDDVRLVVWDRNPELPEQCDPDPDDLSGRGLLLVETLAADWGAEPAADAGKSVWCRISA